MAQPYDILIIGAGHNGLACAAYLARAGLRVKMFEARGIVGGAAVTEAFHPGFRNSSCSYVVSMLHPQIQEDLELARHGLKIVELKQEMTVPVEDGRSLVVGTDREALARQLDTFAPGDGAAYLRFEHLLTEVANVVRGIALKTPPNLMGGWVNLLTAASQGAAARKLDPEARQFFAQLMTTSIGHMLDKWFKGTAIRGALGFLSSIGNFQSPYTPGSAYILLHHVFGEATGTIGAWGHVIGGMGGISDALRADAVEHGVDIEVNAKVERLLLHDGRAMGLRLHDGREFHARAVVSNTHPKILFERLIDRAALPADFRRDVAHYRSGSGTLRIDVALSELPDFTCLPGTQPQLHHQGSILIAPSLDYLQAAYDEARRDGYAKRPAIELWISSSLDDTLAPAGKHVASLFCQHVSPTLPDGRDWDDEKDAAADCAIATMTEFAPNFAAAVIARRVLSPKDLERDYGLIGGDIFHGTLSLDQIYAQRPVAGYADYRTPIGGLYMCGSGTHPGGGVSAIPGRNSAREILKEVRPARSWRKQLTHQRQSSRSHA